MQLQEMPWMQNIVKIQISILVCFPLDFVSLWREVCSLFTALMYRTPTLSLLSTITVQKLISPIQKCFMKMKSELPYFLLCLTHYYLRFITSFHRS